MGYGMQETDWKKVGKVGYSTKIIRSHWQVFWKVVPLKIDNHFHNILRLFDVLPNLFSPQVKRCAIITYKHGMYELPHELPNGLRS